MGGLRELTDIPEKSSVPLLSSRAASQEVVVVILVVEAPQVQDEDSRGAAGLRYQVRGDHGAPMLSSPLPLFN